MPCNAIEFIAHIKQDNDLNMIFSDFEIPVRIKYYNPKLTQKILANFFDNTAECAHTIDEEDDIPLVIEDIKAEKIIGVLVLTAYPKCLYITYQCVHDVYQSQGWGSFLTFIAIFFAKSCGFHYVFAVGVSGKQIATEYERVGGHNVIDVSQQMNLKFGFEDFFSAKTYTIERMKHFSGYCGAVAETALDLRLGNLIAYEKYKNELVNDPQTKFAKFLNLKNKKK